MLETPTGSSNVSPLQTLHPKVHALSPSLPRHFFPERGDRLLSESGRLRALHLEQLSNNLQTLAPHLLEKHSLQRQQWHPITRI